MVKKKHKYTKKTKGRMLIIFLFFATIIFTLGYTLFNNLQQINSMSNQKKELKKEKTALKQEQESLEADIERLSDPEYIARYAREKYFYSKNNELIIRMDD